jgi:hypothetical protein
MDTPRVSHGAVQVGARPSLHVNQFGLGQRCRRGVEIAMAYWTRAYSGGQSLPFPKPFPSMLQEEAFRVRAHACRTNRSRNPVVHQCLETGDDRVPQPSMGLGRHKASLLHNGGQTESTCRVSVSPERSFGSPNVAPSVRQQGVIEPVRYACRPRQFAGLTEDILGSSTRPLPGSGELRGKETERGGMVGTTGFEPATSWSQTKCSTRLSYVPNRETLPTIPRFGKAFFNTRGKPPPTSPPGLDSRELNRQLQGRLHARGISDTTAGDIVACAVVRGGPHEGHSHRPIHAGLEGHQLQRR